MQLNRVCPDCGTHLDARTGAQACETCWLIVPQSARDSSLQLAFTGRWLRLPPALQRVPEIALALRELRLVVTDR